MKPFIFKIGVAMGGGLKYCEGKKNGEVWRLPHQSAGHGRTRRDHARAG